MRIGIFTRYRNNDTTHYALTLANWLRQRRVPVSIRTQGKPDAVDPYWDKLVERGGTFTSWAKKCTAVIWTHRPPIDQVSWTRKQKIRTIYTPPWSDLDTSALQLYSQFFRVVLPSRVSAELLRKAGVENAITIPVYPGLPVTIKNSRPASAQLQILFDLTTHDKQPSCSEWLHSVANILDSAPDSSACVMHAQLPGKARKVVKELRQEFQSRFTAHDRLSHAERHLCFSRADLSVIPLARDDFGLAVSTSMYLGTPVIAYNMPPASELIRNARNGLLVDTTVSVIGSAGIRQASMHYSRMEKVVAATARQPAVVAELQSNTNDGLQNRMLSYWATWGKLLKLG